MSYAYSPRLKAPDKSIDVNMEKPAVVRMMKALCRAKEKDITPEWMAKRGVVLEKKEYPGKDGTMLPVFVISPVSQDVGEQRENRTGDSAGQNALGNLPEKAGKNLPEKAQEHLPGMVYLHGGAYALPVQQPALELAAVYARELGAKVFVPEYRLLPEYSGRVIFEDCLALWEQLSDSGWAQGNAWDEALDGERLLLYGESAGGALAAGLALYLRDRQQKLPRGMFLIYPVLDTDDGYASKSAYAEAAWSQRSNASMWKTYLGGADTDWLNYLVPMKHPDVTGLPSAYIEPQEFDILRDEAQTFGKRLTEAGIPCRVNLIGGSYHSFDMDLSNSFVQEVVAERVAEMKKYL